MAPVSGAGRGDAASVVAPFPDAGTAGRGAAMDGVPVRRAAGARPLASLAASGVLLASMLAALLIGAADIPPEKVALQLLDWLPFVSADSGLAPVEQGLLAEIRLPRVLLGAIVGGLLAIAGAGYQGVFRNPLADPYLLGAAAGAGLMTTTAIVFMKGDETALPIPAAAFAGAIGGVLLAYALGNVAGRGGGTATLVLAGVAVSSFLTAIQTFLQQLRVDELQRIYAWILGDVGGGWSQIALVAPYAVVSVVIMLLHGRLLDVLSVGDDEAVSLGLNVARVRLVVLLAASLATAAAVAVSGLIGFVGIVVPHVVRRLAGGSYRTVLPLSLIGGAAFLVLADLIARTVLAPAELPIGVVTAFVGAPFFVAVLRVTRRVET
ncbi:ferric ion ABC transpoter (permease) [Streptosporangium roseum DSM 43021]|uniref:Ferric ion ABC transpoter (Permease) n=2 Tax=Streptosporangium roseum TaxID=2001 RepID=D2B319_STRRD|nr:ferric ion ABC transpoter (permease) [Streptosporangium roseum DSM 43021]